MALDPMENVGKIELVKSILEENCGILPDGGGLYDWQIETVAREIVSALEKTIQTWEDQEIVITTHGNE